MYFHRGIAIVLCKFSSFRQLLGLLYQTSHWLPQRAKLKSDLKSCIGKQLLNWFKFVGNLLEKCPRETYFVVRVSKSIQSCCVWDFWLLTVQTDLWRLMLRPKTTIEWLFKICFLWMPKSFIAHSLVFSTTCPSSLSDLWLLLYHVQMTASTSQDNESS